MIHAWLQNGNPCRVVMARNDGGCRLFPIKDNECPYKGEICCVSGSGDSLCGGNCGGNWEGDEPYVLCHEPVTPNEFEGMEPGIEVL